VRREWDRYEGNALRDLFRTLRVRFLRRHALRGAGKVLDVGPGPGRFSPHLRPSEGLLALLDLSREALRGARENLARTTPRGESARTAFVRGDGARPPFVDGVFDEVVLFGNVLGFSGPEAPRLLARSALLVAPGGSLLAELAPGGGERSMYVHRIPSGAFRRTLASPLPWLLRRVRSEPFRPAPEERAHAGFRRLTVAELQGLLGPSWTVEEAVAVAPATGRSPELLEAVRPDGAAWHRLLELEEAIGHDPERQGAAAALLVAFRRAGPSLPAERTLK
jgi:SAM-dependent methyltransferase